MVEVKQETAKVTEKEPAKESQECGMPKARAGDGRRGAHPCCHALLRSQILKGCISIHFVH